ncbi:MAG TPA: hypothetical protein VIX59_02730 [Candidatus Binataceae bacterium]
MKVNAIFGAVAAVATAGLLYNFVVLTALAQVPPDGTVIQGNPPPPHCGPGENGITKDGQGCGVGPLFHSFNPNRTPEEAAKEREQEQAQRKAECDAHPDDCNIESQMHFYCRWYPDRCFPPRHVQSLGTITHSDTQWGDPATGKTYLIDPDTHEIIKEVGQAPQSPPDQVNP